MLWWWGHRVMVFCGAIILHWLLVWASGYGGVMAMVPWNESVS
jgi:hypothetical protein